MALSPTSSRATVTTTLYDTTLAAGATSIDSGAGGFSAGFTTLYIYIVVRGANAVVGSQGASIRFNNDSGNNYYAQRFNASNTTPTTSTATTTAGVVVTIADAGNAANFPGVICVVVPNYSATTYNKSGTLFQGFADTAAASMREDTFLFAWNSTAAISRVAIVSTTADNFLAGSRLTIVGV